MAEQPTTKKQEPKKQAKKEEPKREQPKKDISNKLESKLEKRPSAKEAGYGLDTNLAPTLQATAKKLQTEQKKDIVDKTLKSRPTAENAGVDTHMAASIQPTAKTLENKMRRNSLKVSLNARPEVQDLIDSGILKPYAQNLANSLQYEANKLEQALASQVSEDYLKEIGVLEPYKKNVDSSHLDVEEASSLLLRALMSRPTPRGVMEKQGGTQFGFSNVSSTLQETAKHLDVQQKKDKLGKALANRPTPRGVMDKQAGQLGYSTKNVDGSLQQTIKDLGKEMLKDVIRENLKSKLEAMEDDEKTPPSQPAKHRRRASSFDATTLAPSLQAMANKLSLEQKKNTLKEQLGARPDAQELIDKSILKPYASSLANRLQLEADMLEQQLAIRVSENYLKELGILDPYKHNVDSSPISTDIESKANLILKSLIAKKKRRESGGDKHELAATLASTAKKLESEQRKDTLKHKLQERPSSDVQEKVGIDNSVAPTLQATKKKLETAQKGDIVSKTLSTRTTAAEHGVDIKISPAIQSIAKQLESQIKRDKLNTKMNARPEVQDLIDQGVLKPYAENLANSLQLDASRLENALANQVSKDYLKEIGVLEPYKKNVDSNNLNIEEASGLLLRALVSRPTPRKIASHQGSAFGFQNVAPTLQSAAKHLDIEQKKDKLGNALANRPTPRGVMDKQAGQLGYETNAAASLQQTIKDLGREMIKNALDKALRERPSAAEAGIDTKSAPSIQGAMHELDMAQKRDSVSRSMKRRPSAEDAGVDTQLARGLQGIAKTLEMEMKADQVSHKLGDLGIVKKQETEGVVTKIDELLNFLDNYQFDV
mmetsp:Transcript_1625/g.1351  ORF Transcript_1625/g.1351 Transcript_1625/m.1351 type:complete len:828 (+) Transcript_1625:101-2584(+)|eukprot:CAMPEP_0201564724 /NCGR_PEP_ID=MMETSP0190_2-20130828/3256_1 /ASSEMBLY_ACC=CAM_ASM_000263 /TAXON_ID=37353 /ORGANISM="Rosalina sp." /LENGTH=827 /DNA_ID=CAMNT_0047981277 /DNA_START=92 /DNA_END=2575 /DNA_ORIENTATION=-